MYIIGVRQLNVFDHFLRCIFTNINPETGMRHPQREPFETLVKRRTIIPEETPVMGTQLGIRVTGKISIGDTVYINDENDESEA